LSDLDEGIESLRNITLKDRSLLQKLHSFEHKHKMHFETSVALPPKKLEKYSILISVCFYFFKITVRNSSM
jgi:hypothetical protein